MKKVLFFVAVIIGISFILFNFIKNRSTFIDQENSQDNSFSETTMGLPEAKQTEVVELKSGDTYDLTASMVKKNFAGSEVKMLAYNGSIPGPLIKIPKDAEIILNFKNETDVDTTIHSHGVRVENKFDGVADITQEPVKPGESFTYKLKFPDEGMFWYHPHIREDYAQELGLYGNFLVIPDAPDYWAEVDREEALFLDDILFEEGRIKPFSKTNVDHTLMGRFGNTMLINGNDNYQLSVKQGERVRFYITNAANTRVFNFSIPNTRMKLVGSDNGKYEKEEWIDFVVIGPSERQIVEVWFDKDGDYKIANLTPEKSYDMGLITVEKAPVTTSYLMVLRTNEDFVKSLDSIRSVFTKPADKNLTLTLDMMGSNSSVDTSANEGGHHMMGSGEIMQDNQMSMGDVQKIEWEDDMGMMNTQSTKDTLKWKLVDDITQKANMDIEWQFKQGDLAKIKIFNDDKSMHPMQHPIHIHGQRFLVVSTNGEQNKNLVWKDTILIQTGDIVELLVQMDNPGSWMIHCHIPEHMEAGMMSKFEVI